VPPRVAERRNDAGVARDVRASVRAGPLLPARQPEHVEPAAAAAPVVRVSIGRIEVRAISAPPPAAVRPTVASPPKRGEIVLEEYLRARGKSP
jgi:hypothetical protein